jgi:hypothetical protein
MKYNKTQGHTYWKHLYINNREALKQGVNLYAALKRIEIK